jgi:hypothetical protein
MKRGDRTACASADIPFNFLGAARAVVPTGCHMIARHIDGSHSMMVTDKQMHHRARLDVSHAQYRISRARHGDVLAMKHLVATHRQGMAAQHVLALALARR